MDNTLNERDGYGQQISFGTDFADVTYQLKHAPHGIVISSRSKNREKFKKSISDLETWLNNGCEGEIEPYSLNVRNNILNPPLDSYKYLLVYGFRCPYKGFYSVKLYNKIYQLKNNIWEEVTDIFKDYIEIEETLD